MMEERLLTPFHFSQWKRRITQSIIESLQLSTTCEIHSGHKGPIHTLDVDSLESRFLLTGGNDCKISFYDLWAQKRSRSEDEECRIHPIATTARSETCGHNFAVTGVGWYPNDVGAFISCSFDETVLVWDTERMEIAGRFGLGSKVNIATMHPQGIHNLVACGTAGAGVRLCDLNSGDCSHVLGEDNSTIMTVDWNPTSDFVLVSGSADGVVSVWDIRQGGARALLNSFDQAQDHCRSGSSSSGSFSIPSRRRELGIAKGKSVSGIPWNRQVNRIAHNKDVMCVKFSSCGRHLLSSGNDRSLRLWNVRTGKLYPIKYARGAAYGMRYQVDVSDILGRENDLLLYPDDKTGDIVISTLHSSTGEPTHVLSGHLAMPTAVKLLPDASVVSCGRDGMVFLWEKPMAAVEADNEDLQTIETFGDRWSDDEDEQELSARRPRFQPEILRKYGEDCR